jgi:hypothetical protein
MEEGRRRREALSFATDFHNSSEIDRVGVRAPARLETELAEHLSQGGVFRRPSAKNSFSPALRAMTAGCRINNVPTPRP